MPVKYECPRCEKRFVEWGAQKLKFKCPTCDGEELIRVGSGEDRPVKKPTLRKRAKAPAKGKGEEVIAAVPDAGDDEEYVEEEVEAEVLIGAGTEVLVKGDDDFDDDAVVDDEDAEIVDDEEVPQDLEFEEEGMGNIDLDEKL